MNSLFNSFSESVFNKRHVSDSSEAALRVLSYVASAYISSTTAAILELKKKGVNCTLVQYQKITTRITLPNRTLNQLHDYDRTQVSIYAMPDICLGGRQKREKNICDPPPINVGLEHIHSLIYKQSLVYNGQHNDIQIRSFFNRPVFENKS